MSSSSKFADGGAENWQASVPAQTPDTRFHQRQLLQMFGSGSDQGRYCEVVGSTRSSMSAPVEDIEEGAEGK